MRREALRVEPAPLSPPPHPRQGPGQTLTVQVANVFQVTLVIGAPVVAVDLEYAIVKAAVCVFIDLRYVEVAFHKSQTQPLEQGEEDV